ncbi:dihydroorotase [Chakrabartyella piscis]|uniref:dihydroorotase n=1 Tax=Chakrabartyella piscis TaxID=2918914 RepID=UPI0029588751|nr:dihydroorotase [Chakrabartyella piscis]
MNYIISNVSTFIENRFVKSNIFIQDGIISDISSADSPNSYEGELLRFENSYILPGFIDVHVHLREPGFFYKETIETGSKAAAHGGYTTVCAMPNLNPTPDSYENLKPQLESIEKNACIHVLPYGTITIGELGKELANLKEMAPYVCGFSDDGRGVQDDEMMKSAMKQIKELDMILAAHCEDNSLLFGGYIHDGEYAKEHGHKGICSASEWKQVERDLKLVKEIGCKYHVCHISCKETVDIIRRAKAEGVNVTCETGPHYLVMNDSMLQEDGRFKMNPPIRSEEDRQALLNGLLDGTIDMIATDHAPHSAEEKSKGLQGSAMGIVGLETAFPVLYTELVHTGILSLEKLVELMHTNPRKRFGIGTEFAVGQPADFTVYNLDSKYVIDPETFLSKGHATPFTGKEVQGECVLTMCGGKIAYQKI